MTIGAILAYVPNADQNLRIQERFIFELIKCPYFAVHLLAMCPLEYFKLGTKIVRKFVIVNICIIVSFVPKTVQVSHLVLL